MAITTMAQALAAFPGQSIRFIKTITPVGGAFVSPWLSASLPVAGAAPSSGLAGDVPTDATTGAPAFVNAASGGLSIARLEVGVTGAAQAGMVFLYDRLWHNSGINATAVTAQTVNSVALTRPDALGGQAELWYQVYVVMGAGTPQITVTYTDQDGNTGNTALSGTLATTMAVGRTGQFQLAAGDTGVRSIQTYQADATFTSGTIGLVLRRMLGYMLIPGQFTTNLAPILQSGLVTIPSDACLELVYLSASGNGAVINADLTIVQG